VEIDYALIADHADIAGGKLYLNGGGWDRYTLASVPGTVRMAVAIGIRFDWEETNQPVPVRVVVQDDDGKEAARISGQVNVGRPPGLTPGSSQLAHMAVNIQMTVQAYGGYRVAIDAGGEGDGRSRLLPFRVIEQSRTT
jgi:hypothetical protein